MKASYREIKEETGFSEDEIINFRLKYVLIEMREGELRQQFVYFGETKHPNFIVSDEGELFWIPQNELKQLRTSTLIKEMLEHYSLHPNENNVIMGTLTLSDDQTPFIQWGSLIDPKVF
ncbi:hypothetical protein [Paenibacillus sp. UNC451MF]|uniref:hypothetical protein n=1 Tax=Paenibacillus sp. UNC451MF TaxID=1449063 RepID=UPI000B2B00C2|nr:hypothetical protein [Paenibacillus sp. UNC451MF]